MKYVFDFMVALTGSQTWTWIIIGLVALLLTLLVLTLWCMLVLGSWADDQSEKIYRKMKEEERLGLMKANSQGG